MKDFLLELVDLVPDPPGGVHGVKIQGADVDGIPGQISEVKQGFQMGGQEFLRGCLLYTSRCV